MRASDLELMGPVAREALEARRLNPPGDGPGVLSFSFVGDGRSATLWVNMTAGEAMERTPVAARSLVSVEELAEGAEFAIPGYRYQVLVYGDD